MNQDDLKKTTAEIQQKFPDIGIKSIEVDENTGKATFMIAPTQKSLAFLERGGVVPKVYRGRESAATITRDYVQRTNLDLAQPDPYTEDPIESFNRAIKYYYTDPLVGSATNILANLAKKGFENDWNVPKIQSHGLSGRQGNVRDTQN